MIKVAFIVQPLFLALHYFKELVSVLNKPRYYYNQFNVTITERHNSSLLRKELKLVGLQGNCDNSITITELIVCHLRLKREYCKL